jgi:hypothetical protein
MKCRIWGFHGDYEERHLMGCGVSVISSTLKTETTRSPKRQSIINPHSILQ